eukprot:TRINITY_DN13360_c0_g1_i10.p1 TRINITY_DN13360_c0_g1~~TRINITY_DN13360_c0_g1_i10.p1  ORF type:complete len:284 (-),score=55.64 TRINITY_DN13360_c0_g1_i10:85-936(-)
MLPQLRSSVSFDIIQSPIFEEAYLGFEKNAISRFLRTNFCVGILVMKKDQKTEEEFFSNMQVSRSFMHFFLSIAKIVELKGWSRYDGELDTTKGRNGTHSLYTMGYGIEIMFHVSTMLAPGSEGHVSKKRYIGNDSVVIIFQELGCTKPFAISSMPSHMNRVFIVVKALPKYNRKWRYHISVSRKSDVPQFGPALSYPPIYTIEKSFEKMFLRLVINAQLAVDRSPINTTGQSKHHAKAFQELVLKLKKKKKVQRMAPDITATSSVGLSGAVNTLGTAVLNTK